MFQRFTERILLITGLPGGLRTTFIVATDLPNLEAQSWAANRFSRPVCFQKTPNSFPPHALEDANPGGIRRKINGQYTRDAVAR
jgi:NADP-dependent aldehyde dehydrogenase